MPSRVIIKENPVSLGDNSVYVCICRGVTEKQIRQVTQQQGCSMQELAVSMGIGADCGCCKEYACQLLEEITNNSSSITQTMTAK